MNEQLKVDKKDISEIRRRAAMGNKNRLNKFLPIGEKAEPYTLKVKPKDKVKWKEAAIRENAKSLSSFVVNACNEKAAQILKTGD